MSVQSTTKCLLTCAALASVLYLGIDAAQRLLQQELPTQLEEIATAAPEEHAKLLSHRVKKGDTLAKICSAFGATSLHISRIGTLWRSLEAPPLAINQELFFKVSATGEFEELHTEIFGGDEITISNNPELKIIYGMRTPVGVVEGTTTVSGTITSSFVAAARTQGLSFETIDAFVDLFSNQVEFNRSLQPADTFTVKFTSRVSSTGTPLQDGDILEASLRTAGKLLIAVGVPDANRKLHYFDQDGEAIGNYFLRYPVQFSRISSTFTTERFHPVLKRSRPHNGVDFAARTGTPVRAIGDGKITHAGWLGSAGLVVRINHIGDRFRSECFHLSKIPPSIRVGSRVTRGQVIGYVGSTGVSTGPHLHFGLFDRGRYVNPLTAKLPAMAPAGVKISKEKLLAKLKEIEKVHHSLEADAAQAF